LTEERPEALHQRVVRAWCLYDWANSAFATTVMAAVLPTFYRTVAGAGLEGNRATVYWGFTAALAMLIVALSAPILGAVADYCGIKKRLLAASAALGIGFTAMLYFVSTGQWLKASVFFILAHMGFAGANIFYDSLLPHIAREGEIDQVSAKGYALGYLGGGLLLAVNLAMLLRPSMFFLPNGEMAARASFVTVAVWWALFSIPLFRRVREPAPVRVVAGPEVHPLLGGFRRLRATFRELRRYRQLVKFLLAFWLYNDGIGTIIKMAVIYGSEIGIGTTDLIGALLLTQFIGIPCALLFGRLAGRIGAKRSIFLALGVYTGISASGFFMSQAWHFWAMAAMVGLVQGGAQALSRSLFGAMVPKSRSAEFFGFYEVSSKFAGIAGPFLFGLVGHLAGTSRWGILSLIVFFVGGGLLLATVDEKEGIEVARAED